MKTELDVKVEKINKTLDDIAATNRYHAKFIISIHVLLLGAVAALCYFGTLFRKEIIEIVQVALEKIKSV